MPNKKLPAHRYSADRNRQRNQGKQQRPRPATEATGVVAPANTPVAEAPIAPAVTATAPQTPAPAYRPATRSATGMRGRTAIRAGNRAVAGLNTNWMVVSHDLKRVALIMGAILLVLVVLTFLLPALHLI